MLLCHAKFIAKLLAQLSVSNAEMAGSRTVAAEAQAEEELQQRKAAEERTAEATEEVATQAKRLHGVEEAAEQVWHWPCSSRTNCDHAACLV